MADPKNNFDEMANSVQNIYTIKEHLVDKDLTDLESRLNEKIDTVKTDLSKRMNRSESRLMWFIGVGLAAATLIIKYL